MRVVVRNPSLFYQSQSLLALAGTATYSAEDVEKILSPHFHADGSCTSLALDFEGEYIPVCNRNELRLVARLVSVAHNACVDPLYSKKSTSDEIENLRREQLNGAVGDEESENEEFYDAQEKQIDQENFQIVKRNGSLKQLQHTKKVKQTTCWNEEKFGEQRIFDDTFEMNAEISDRMMQTNIQTIEEKFGMYV